MRRIIFSRQARKDVVEIWHVIRSDNVAAAGQVIDAIETAIRLLTEVPGAGHVHPDIPDPRFRVRRVYSYLIVYRFDARSLSIARIVHGARNLRRLFGKKK